MKIVMIGGGGACIVSANTLRVLGNSAQIDIYTRREKTAYTPCEQPFVLRDILSFEDMFYAPLPWFKKKQIGLHTQRNVEYIDREKKIIHVDGREVAYDTLLINTGAINKTTAIPGLEGDRVHYLTTELQHAERLKMIMEQGGRAVILGGGVISLEMADTLVENGYSSVSIIVSAEHPFSQQLDADMGKKLAPIFQKKGVNLYFSTSVVKAESNENDIRLFLSNGETLEADWVFVAKGIVPDVDLARKAGLKIGKTGGIEVNRYLQTSDPSIYAAGDCIEGWHMVSGKKTITALATHSNRNGRLIGRNIHFGNTIPFAGSLNTFGAEVFGTTIVSVGITENEAKDEGLAVLTSTRKGVTRKKMFNGEDFWVKLVVDKDRQTVIGSQMIGPREISRIGERIILMIGEEIPLGKISQYETIFSPPLSNAYDLITNEVDILISELLKTGESVIW
ncbi:MAG: FAD-dependent oxidoreductase [Thermodesulfobacteriota bacterium]|nr:FAD-dependent oxidoreductase [Thermodesulfobacteriota bacterium]